MVFTMQLEPIVDFSCQYSVYILRCREQYLTASICKRVQYFFYLILTSVFLYNNVCFALQIASCFVSGIWRRHAVTNILFSSFLLQELEGGSFWRKIFGVLFCQDCGSKTLKLYTRLLNYMCFFCLCLWLCVRARACVLVRVCGPKYQDQTVYT